MSVNTVSAGYDPALICRIEQFYYREARLLDNRQYQQWLELLDPSIVYTMPNRYIPHADYSQRETEAFLAVDRELERDGPDALPMREETYQFLAFKAKRTYRADSWSDNPPARTRRMVSNVEVEALGEGNYKARSNVFMFYSSRGANNHLYTLGREDILREDGDQFRVLRREVVTDEALVTVPTLTLFF